MKPRRSYLVFIHIAAVAVAGLILAPFGWLLFASLSSQNDLLARPLSWIPRDPTLERYRAIATTSGADVAGAFRTSLLTSTIVAGSTVVISMCVGVLGAYAFARLRFRLRRMTLALFLSTYMLPPIAIIIPIYLILSTVGLLDSKLGLIIVYCSFVTPFVLWIMSNFFLSLPQELEDAARVDGCSRLGALFRIVLPIARPGLFATMMFAFLLAWDEFLYALVLTSSSNAKTVPVAIAEFTGRFSVDFGLVAAGGVLASVPPVLLALAFQRYIVGGLTSGAVKG